MSGQYFTEFSLAGISAPLLCSSLTKYFVSLCAVLLLWVKMTQSKLMKTRKISECPVLGKCSDLCETDLPTYESAIKCFCYA